MKQVHCNVSSLLLYTFRAFLTSPTIISSLEIKTFANKSYFFILDVFLSIVTEVKCDIETF